MKEVKFDFKLLKLKIKEVFDTQAKFAEAIEMGLVSVNQRLNNVICWSPADIIKACDVLKIPRNEIYKYFFTVKNTENGNK